MLPNAKSRPFLRQKLNPYIKTQIFQQKFHFNSKKTLSIIKKTKQEIPVV